MIFLSGFSWSEIAELFRKGNLEAAEETILKYHALFGEDYYLELVRIGGSEHFEAAYTNFLIEMSRKHNIKVVAANYVRRCNKEDIPKMEKLYVADFNNEDARHKVVPTEDWLKSETEMLTKFSDCPEAISNTEEIVNKIEVFDVPKWKAPIQHRSYLYHLKKIKNLLNT